MKEDSVGRPIYKRKQPTSQGKQVYLYHIHQTKKWRIGPAHEGAEAHNCWLFITSKGKILVQNTHIWRFDGDEDYEADYFVFQFFRTNTVYGSRITIYMDMEGNFV